MKKFFSLLLVIALSAGLFCSCGSKEASPKEETAETGLRDITWGMTRSEVRKAEKAELVGADDGYLRFYDEDASQPIVFMGVNTRNKVDLWYYFNSDDKLFKIEYRLANGDINKEVYTHVKELMRDKYGDPYEEDASDAEVETHTSTSWKSAKSDITLDLYYREGKSKNTLYVTFLPNN